eukprot:111309_1
MHSNTQNALRSVTKIVYNAYVDIDCVTEPSGPDCANWIEITKIKLQERESKLLTIIKHKIESIVSETYPTSGATQPTPQPATLSHPRSFIVSSYAMNVTSSVLAKSINGWKGINLSRLKHSPTVYRDYFNVSKKSWDRRKTKFFGSSLWVNVFKEIHHFVYMDLFRLIQILKALFSATIRYNNTRPQPLINGMVITNSSELHQYFDTLDLSFRIHEWHKEHKKNGSTKHHAARSLHQKMQSHLDYILDGYKSVADLHLTEMANDTYPSHGMCIPQNNHNQPTPHVYMHWDVDNYLRQPDLPPPTVITPGGYCASRHSRAAPRTNTQPYATSVNTECIQQQRYLNNNGNALTVNRNAFDDGVDTIDTCTIPDVEQFYDTFTEYL